MLGKILGNGVNALANVRAKWSNAQEPEGERKRSKGTARGCQGRGCYEQLSTTAALEGPQVEVICETELDSDAAMWLGTG